MSTPADLITWLRAQLDEDEREASRVEPNQAPRDLRAMVTRDGSPPFLVIDSARVLAEVDAKRRILDEHQHYTVTSGFGCGICAFNGRDGVIEPEGWCVTVSALTLPFADRPGYLEEWRPA